MRHVVAMLLYLSIKLLNRFTYLPETQAPGIFEQALAINMAVFTVSSTQARVFVRFSNLERSIRKNSTLRSAVPAHDDANAVFFFSHSSCFCSALHCYVLLSFQY